MLISDRNETILLDKIPVQRSVKAALLFWFLIVLCVLALSVTVFLWL